MAITGLGTVERSANRLLNRRLRAVIPPVDVTPLQVTVLYALFGFAALYFSDVYLPARVSDPDILGQLQAVKGAVEVALTAVVVFVLSARSRRSLEQQRRRLQLLQSERSVLHRVFRHNLRQHVNVALGNAAMIRTADGEDVDRLCDDVTRAIERIVAYQDKIRLFDALLDAPTQLAVVDLVETIREQTRLRELEADDAVSVDVSMPEEAIVVTSPYLPVAIDEVLENAIEHNDANSPEIAITVRSDTDGFVEALIADNGSGIPSYEIEAIDQFEEDQLTHSSGLGLWLATLTCTLSGGELVFPDQDGGGRVLLRVPLEYRRTARHRFRWLLGLVD